MKFCGRFLWQSYLEATHSVPQQLSFYEYSLIASGSKLFRRTPSHKKIVLVK